MSYQPRVATLLCLASLPWVDRPQSTFFSFSRWCWQTIPFANTNGKKRRPIAAINATFEPKLRQERHVYSQTAPQLFFCFSAARRCHSSARTLDPQCHSQCHRRRAAEKQKKWRPVFVNYKHVAPNGALMTPRRGYGDSFQKQVEPDMGLQGVLDPSTRQPCVI